MGNIYNLFSAVAARPGRRELISHGREEYRRRQLDNVLSFIHITRASVWISTDFVWGQRLMSVVGRMIALIGSAAAVACTEPTAESRYIGNWVLQDTLTAASSWVTAGGNLTFNGDRTFDLIVPSAPTHYNGTWTPGIDDDVNQVEMDSSEGAWFGELKGPYLVLSYSGCCRGFSVYRYRR